MDKALHVASGPAFGLDITSDFTFPGLVPGNGGYRGPSVRTRRGARDVLNAAWPAETEFLIDRRRFDGRALMRVETHPAEGFRMSAIGWGRYLIAPDGSEVVCGPVRMPRWRWQRFLVGQVLPFVSLMHGFEVLHASAVARGSHTIAFCGKSRAGKSTVASGLLLHDWALLADDVVAIDTDGDGRPRAHPAPSLLSIRHDVAELMGTAALARLGREIGADENGRRLVVPIDPEPRRLTALYFLERASAGSGLAIEPLRPVNPTILLTATFNFLVRTPERLTRQLDVCALIARTTGLYRLRVPENVAPDVVARYVDEHVRTPRPAAAR